MNQPIETNNANEVDLTAWVKKIWCDKWILVALMILTGIGAVYLAKTNQPYQAKVSIKPILLQASSPFKEIKALIPKEQLNASPQALVELFYHALQYTNTVDETLASSAFIQQISADQRESTIQALRDILLIVPPNKKPRSPAERQTHLQITLPSVLSPSEFSASGVIESIINNANQFVINEMLYLLEQAYKFKNREYSQRMLTVQHQLQLAIQKQNQEQLARITFLSEQAAIARSVDRDRASTSVLYGTNTNDFVIGISKTPHYHFLGYKAIEEELKEIKNRDAKYPELHSEEIRNLKIKLQGLQKNLDLKILDDSIQYLKANIKAFKVIRIDLKNLNYSQRINALNALLMGLFLGLFLGLLIISFRIILISPEPNKAS